MGPGKPRGKKLVADYVLVYRNRKLAVVEAKAWDGADQLAEMQKIINAEKSDIFDVLAYVAFQLPPESREDRANRASAIIDQKFESNQVAFLSFVLSQYVRVGVEELSPEKLSPLLKLRYNNAIADAVQDLGEPEQIGKLFADFQQYLYL
jgi:type I restriction enzyme R subunit